MSSLQIWKDRIVLRVDLKDEEALPGPELAPYVKFNEKFNAYLLSFSAQNLRRIYAQYGKISVIGDRTPIDILKKDLSYLVAMKELVKRIKSGEFDKVKIGYKMPPLALYQHRLVLFLSMIEKAPLFADCGCLSEDTGIKFSQNGTSRVRSISWLYRQQERRGQALKTKVRSFKETHIGLHPIKKIVQSGIKVVWRLDLEDGKFLEPTPDHEILTKRGMVELQNLTTDDMVMVDNLSRHQKKKNKSSKKLPDCRRAVGMYHPYARYQSSHGGRSGSYLVEQHRLIYEAYASGVSVKDFVIKTRTGKIKGLVFVNTSTHDIHHKDGDHYNNDPENLEPLTKSEHQKLHSKHSYSHFGHGIPEYSKVRRVSVLGEKMTYDIICEDPHRNFAANEIIVHNCGKTYAVLVATEHQIKNKMLLPGKTLICGKLATMETGWLEDAEKFTDLKVSLLWQSSPYKKKEKILKKLEEPADIYLINHDGVRVFEKELAEKKFDKIVVDESTVLKSFSGEHSRVAGGAFGKSLMNVSRGAKWKVVMSGTPAPNSIQDLWGQFKFLDPQGLLMEPGFYDFRHSYMEKVFFGKLARDENNNPIRGVPEDPKARSTWVSGKNSVARIKPIIDPLTYRLRIRDHLKDLPELTAVVRPITLTKKQMQHYEEMEESLATTIDDEYVTVPNRLAELMKLRQITGGFLIDKNSVAHPIPKNPKLDALDSLVHDEIDVAQKIVIFCEYRWEIETIQKRYKEYGTVSVYGGNSSKRNLQSIKEFIHDPSKRIIILHPKSAAHGITLVVSHYLIFYSISHSAEDNYQAVKRIERAGQKHVMFAYYLIAKGVIDTKIYRAVQSKLRNQELLIDQPRVDNSLLKNWRTSGRKR